jgi:hypothetical protein
MCKVFYKAYEDGYNHAIGLLRNVGPRLFGCGFDEYLDKNMEKIHRQIDAINELKNNDQTSEESKYRRTLQQKAAAS